MSIPKSATLGLFTLALIAASFVAVPISKTWAVTPTHYPVAFILCTSPDQGAAQELPTSYYQDMITPGTGGVADWFQQVSRSAADLAGSQVLGPYVIDLAGPAYPPGTSMTLERWNGLRRYDRIQACAGAAADAGVDLTRFQEIVAVDVAHEWDPSFIPPKGVTTLVQAASATDTTIQVASAAGFPTPPFPILVGTGDPQNGGTLDEALDVIGESGPNNTTWTVQRGFEEGGPRGVNTCAPGGPSPTNAVPLTAGLQVEVPYKADGGACFVGRINGFTVGTSNQETLNNIGLVAMDPLMSLAQLPHEMSHALFGLAHSSSLSTQTDYQDPWDIMSAFSTYQSAFEPGFVRSSGYDTNPERYRWREGPGFNSVILDRLGWLDPSEEDTTLIGASSCTTHGVYLDPLSILSPQSGDVLEAQLPFTDQPGFPSGQHYTVEFRSPVQGPNFTTWDGGLPPAAVLIHLAPSPGSAFPSYLVDGSMNGALDIEGAQPGLAFVAGSTFVDPASSAFLAVNEIDNSANRALITVGTCPLRTTLAYAGDTSDDFNDTAVLAATLSTDPSSGPSGPVPDQPVTLTLGSQSCSATTDQDGLATCSVLITQTPATTNVTASFPGTKAYAPASTSASFTITPEDTALSYTGPSTAHYHDPFTASAVLTDPADGTPIPNKTVSFTLGGTDTCTGQTDASGTVTCQITPHEAGSETVVASFAGDTDYQAASASEAFAVTPEETTTTYTGPTVILGAGAKVTLSATLVEDGANDADGDGGSPGPVPAEVVTLSIGGQSCSATTDASGNVSCTIPSLTVPLGPQTIVARFAGDPSYQASSASASAVVFAFPTSGAFALGDLSAAGATATTTLTWWSADWSSSNEVSGGPAPRSFKGFVDTVALPASTPPSGCAGSWTTGPATSTSPPQASGIPSFMGVLVTNHVGQSGHVLSGTTVHIVVVKVDPGYAPDPGHPGTGTIVATWC